MGTEIERKFLVRDTRILQGLTGVAIAQGYLSRNPSATVRVRVVDSVGYLTVKGKTEGISRAEFEYRIPIAEARQLLALCEPGLIEKRRYRIAVAQHIWEVDVFQGDNEGLIVAEVELGHAKEQPVIPPWIGAEVSDDPRYFNSALSRKPFLRWGDESQ